MADPPSRSADWRDIVGESMDESYVADAVWERRIIEDEDELTEDKMIAEDPEWTPPPDAWRPESTLGPISTGPDDATGLPSSG